MKHNQISLS